MEYQNIHIRMEKELHERLKEVAADDMRSTTATIHILIKEALEARECEV